MTAPAAIVLAAGEGRRMGGPKALLVIDGKALVHWHVERLREVGCRPIVVVVRTAVLDTVREILGQASDLHIIASNTSSMAASLAIGVEHGPLTAGQTIVISTVDALPVRCSTLQQLISAASAENVQVATPCYRDRGGHPVVVRETLLRPFGRGFPGTLRDLIRSVGPQRRRLSVDDVAVGHDLDTPADLAAIQPGLPDFAWGKSAARRAGITSDMGE